MMLVPNIEYTFLYGGGPWRPFTGGDWIEGIERAIDYDAREQLNDSGIVLYDHGLQYLSSDDNLLFTFDDYYYSLESRGDNVFAIVPHHPLWDRFVKNYKEWGAFPGYA